MQEHLDHGELELHGAALLDSMNTYADWLSLLAANSSPDTVGPDWVMSSTFFAARDSDQKIVGTIDIRHELNEFLASYGGHIGFGVRPSERGHGYAAQMLLLGLEHCRQLKLPKVMLACYQDNIPSAKTILKCGGVLEREFVYTDGKTVQVYWTQLSHPR